MAILNTKKSAVEAIAASTLEIATEATQLKNASMRGTVYERRVSTTCEGWGRKSLEFTVQIDFANVAIEQLYAWSAAKLVIDLQRQLRTLPFEFAQTLAKGAIRRPAADMGLMFDDPTAKARKLAKEVVGMSDEEFAELIAERNAAKKA